MCGIAGFLESSSCSSPEDLKEVSLRMADTLRHRGPDDGGAWVDAQAGVALSMRRLAILDLSEAGHQPMQSASGRYVTVFNGEIYNCEDLRHELTAHGDAPAFRGHSDTEVMLAAFESWGVLNSVQRFNGMFAFGLWDRWGAYPDPGPRSLWRETTILWCRPRHFPIRLGIEGPAGPSSV